MKKNTPSRYGTHRASYNANKKRIFATQSICGICGKPVDFTLKYPNKWAATIDHIIPLAKGGHKSDIDNLQLAHFYCNRMKSDKFLIDNNLRNNSKNKKGTELDGPATEKKSLPLSTDWNNF